MVSLFTALPILVIGFFGMIGLILIAPGLDHLLAAKTSAAPVDLVSVRKQAEARFEAGLKLRLGKV